MRNFRFLAATSNLKFFLAALFFLSAPLFANAQADRNRPPNRNVPTEKNAPLERTTELERNDSERQLFDALNRERAAQGVPAMQWDHALFKAARRHALLMANLNMLEHQLPSEPNLEARLAEAGARFSAIAENIAIGANPQTIHDGWMKSPGHRKNILNPLLISVGIAVVHGPGGLFAVQDFSHPVAVLSVEQQERKVVSLLSGRGWQVTGGTEDARRTCQMERGLAGTGTRSMIRFETPDLSKLPDEVERKIASMHYNRAAVGACRANGAPGFAQYRIAVLFF